MKIMKYISESRFNYIDVTTIAASVNLASNGEYWYALIVAITGSAVSVYASCKY